jgi:tripeptide aminopeptidase
MSEPAGLLLKLTGIASPPGGEDAVAAVVVDHLGDLGLTADEDEFGNIYARIEPTADGTPLFFCAHLDTVPPDGKLEPVLDDGVIRNAGGTILGADNKASVAAMVDAARRVLAENRPHAGIELVFTRQEEVGLLGAAAFDHKRLRARIGYVYDQEGPIGEIVLGAPWARGLEVTFRGRAAHSGMRPEEGRSAIQAAAKGIAKLRLGRVDDETTANVGVIRGGRATNIVPDEVHVHAEARSRDMGKLDAQTAHMRACFEEAAARRPGATVTVTVERQYDPMDVPDDAPVMRLLHAAAATLGRTVTAAGMGGGCDANVLNRRGLEVVNLGTGMRAIHTTSEWLKVSDMVAAAEVTLAAIQLAAG